MNTTSVEKLNLRLIQASEYLQRFYLDVRYKPGKANIVPNILSRLASRESRARPDNESLDVQAYPVSLVEISNKFKQRLLKGYKQEPRWTQIRQII